MSGGQLVSVIIPVYEQEPKRLAAAIASVHAQTIRCELVVVDDGSSEPQVGATLTLPHNSGIAAALNAGIKASSGDWMCWLSSDDEIDPDKVGTQLATLVVQEGRAGFHSYRICRDGVVTGQSWARKWRPAEQRDALLRACSINGSTTMIHRSVFDEVGLYDEGLRYAQDWDMWCRIGKRYQWHAIRRVLGTRHDWRGNLTQRIDGGFDRQRRDAEDQEVKDRHSDSGAWRV